MVRFGKRLHNCTTAPRHNCTDERLHDCTCSNHGPVPVARTARRQVAGVIGDRVVKYHDGQLAADQALRHPGMVQVRRRTLPRLEVFASACLVGQVKHVRKGRREAVACSIFPVVVKGGVDGGTSRPNERTRAPGPPDDRDGGSNELPRQGRVVVEQRDRQHVGGILRHGLFAHVEVVLVVVR